MTNTDILVFREIITNIKNEISNGAIQYSKKEERFIVKGPECQMDRLQEWILKHIKTADSINILNGLYKEIKVKFLDLGTMKFIHVYLVNKNTDYLLLETYI